MRSNKTENKETRHCCLNDDQKAFNVVNHKGTIIITV